MKKHITFILFLLIAVATSAQTLNVVTDNVTYAFPRFQNRRDDLQRWHHTHHRWQGVHH